MARALHLSTVYRELLGRISASGEMELPRKLILSMDEFLLGRIAGDLFRTRERNLQKVFIRVLVGINLATLVLLSADVVGLLRPCNLS